MIQNFGEFSPEVDPSAWIHTGAWVMGEVVLAKGVSVWPGAILRGDMGPIEIGAFTNIQDGAICHNTDGFSKTIVGSRVTVGHGAILHGCVVGDDCIIGMGSIVMDNAIIGEGCFIAAGTLVAPNKVIPAGSMVMGSPGRVVRDIREEEKGQIEYSWKIYLDRMEKWSKESGGQK